MFPWHGCSRNSLSLMLTPANFALAQVKKKIKIQKKIVRKRQRKSCTVTCFIYMIVLINYYFILV